MIKNLFRLLYFAALVLSVGYSALAAGSDFVRGVYGGSPVRPGDAETLADYGVDAVFIGSGGLSTELVTMIKGQGARIFAEFNTMHHARFLEEHPDAAPIGPDGRVAPAPEGWQGVCPTHRGYRRDRMTAFRKVAADFEIDGIWLDYHHAHASWERAEPLLPDTCFCPTCLADFSQATGISLEGLTTAEASEMLLGERHEDWVRWRCDVFTDWVREFREILSEVRPDALLGTFHAPWSDDDFGGARISKLAIDLRAQARYIDVFSPMPYHARFGHADDPSWISRQVSWLGAYLGLEGRPTEDIKIWPIVQLSDWGETVPVSQISEVLEHGIQSPATGVMVFAWGSLRKQPEKVEELKRFYLDLPRK